MLPSTAPLRLRTAAPSREDENSRIDADNSAMRDVLERIKSEVARSNRLLTRLSGGPRD
jgi:hypothetical protein